MEPKGRLGRVINALYRHSPRTTLHPIGSRSLSLKTPFCGGVSVLPAGLSIVADSCTVTDAHCHPTDLEHHGSVYDEVKLGGLAAMATEPENQDLVNDLGADRRWDSRAKRTQTEDKSGPRVVSCFGMSTRRPDATYTRWLIPCLPSQATTPGSAIDTRSPPHHPTKRHTTPSSSSQRGLLMTSEGGPNPCPRRLSSITS